MRHSLQSHITYLEKLIKEVGDRLTQPGLMAEEVEDLRLQLFSAQGALEHYRQAYALELSASGSEPPPNTGETDSRGEVPSGGKPDSGRAKSGRATPATGLRKRGTRIKNIAIALGVSAPRAKMRGRQAERVERERAA